MENVNKSADDLVEDGKSEWLSFKLAGLDYAVDILRVREIRAWEPSTRIPYAPSYVVGLINLRGAIVPIIDMRERIGIETKSYDQETVILILDVELENEDRTIGVVVDAISQVVTTDTQNSQISPSFDLAISKEFVLGIADYGSQMVVLLNIDTLLKLDI
jgi:purine-binding chemotaxis protein CheW